MSVQGVADYPFFKVKLKVAPSPSALFFLGRKNYQVKGGRLL